MIEQAKSIIRLMTIDDIEGVYEVEKNSFPTPWKPSIFINELHVNKYAHYFVCEKEGYIAGYCGLWVIGEDAQITNIAVHSSMRGQKFGEQLLSYAMIHARELGAVHMSLEVRVSNVVAQGLYKKLGFKEGGIRKNYYTDNQEDAMVMWVNLNGE
ncbi:ribosomal protein S18-alanine N-acetyltransferase [Alkalihalophilus marmarensis]|uniref:ribosomal protein S18-alanine N-acetyltransferase n=1 Tax=Alkalihalophilus marmarensis TaxID=521377 RepID=UPI002DBC757E|nr:ribosomal protein S18-alanine N-acetyltransferase [Alkalihalophilus marmarensis]MEC2071078.1 ribosomal protein S18-alanine N-acetyltransferase [Alkalihalophilus marmarensis]